MTNETVIYGLGELHLRIMLERLTEVYKCEVNTRPPRIAYRETITGPAEGHHRHKKQTGGAGQFGEVFLRIEPLPRGAGFEWKSEVFGGSIPTHFLPAVEKGVRDALDEVDCLARVVEQFEFNLGRHAGSDFPSEQNYQRDNARHPNYPLLSWR